MSEDLAVVFLLVSSLCEFTAFLCVSYFLGSLTFIQRNMFCGDFFGLFFLFFDKSDCLRLTRWQCKGRD